MSHILIVGTEFSLHPVREHLVRRSYAPVSTHSGDQCAQVLGSSGSALVVVCLPLPDMSGRRLLRELFSKDPALNVVVCGADDSIANALDALDAGAVEYVEDAASDARGLLSAVGIALGARERDVAVRSLGRREAARASAEGLLGSSPAMQEVLRIVRLLCERSARGGAPTVLISGETGTGKGMLAKQIHYNGGRRMRTLVEANCTAIPATLLESELFGHERGAFTDAHAARPGLFEMADRGTLFLDEIGSVSHAVQAKLLTAIEEKRIRRIGGRRAMQVDVQIIAATHVDLKQAVRDGEFRADLYHRLNVVSVCMPPLRERGDDKLRLAEGFMQQLCKEYGLPERCFTPRAERYIGEYAWPGNVRELKNAIERILLLHNDELIDSEHFDSRQALPAAEHSGTFMMSLPDEGMALDAIEREAIRTALERSSGNVSRAARFLRISRQTLIYRINKHGLNGQPSTPWSRTANGST
ncbi:MAG TPA: sigma-54 dependent transcriptional regulator [Polyangiaceae bacterium]